MTERIPQTGQRTSTPPLRLGQLVLDTETEQVGTLEAIIDQHELCLPRTEPAARWPRVAFLRPQGGGYEWYARPENIALPLDVP
ncbi:hypothetical protein [Streptomyces milbemycinicus]|uniref:hypothetical protein n=1 Tax=Streptomyces milbemycinicus TaxID=476552 RepID=UPI003406DD06